MRISDWSSDVCSSDLRVFASQTDTEVVGHLVAREIERGAEPREAVATVLPRLQGAFALAIMFRGYPDMLIGARLGAPPVVGYGAAENYLGSEALELAPLTQKIAYLEEGDWGDVTRGSVTIFDRDIQPVELQVTQSSVAGSMLGTGHQS